MLYVSAAPASASPDALLGLRVKVSLGLRADASLGLRADARGCAMALPSPNWAWVDIQLTTRHFHNSVPGKLGSCRALRVLVPVGVYQVMKITRDRVNTYGFYSRFGLLSR